MTGGYHPYPTPGAPTSTGGGQRPPHNFPPPLALSDFKYTQPPLTPHSGTMSGFGAAPPQEYQIPQMSAPADATSFSSSYLTSAGSAASAAAAAGRSNSSGGVGGVAGPVGAGAAQGGPGAGAAPGVGGQHSDPERHSRIGNEMGHQRKRSSSHPPPSFQHRDP